MRFLYALPVAVALMLLTLSIPRLTSSQQSDTGSIIERVQDPTQTDQATLQLIKAARSSIQTRRSLAEQLPALIEAGPLKSRAQRAHIDEVWLNNVKLARELKIVETTAALAKWISTFNMTLADTGGLTSASNFSQQPAALALIDIGDPAVPALESVLEHGPVSDRWIAVRALLRIGTPAARSVIRNAAQKESDPDLATYMEKHASK